MKTKIRHIALVLAAAGLLAGCTVNEETGEREFDFAAAEEITETVKDIVETSPVGDSPLGVAVGALMTIVGVGLGYAARAKRDKKKPSSDDNAAGSDAPTR